MLIRGVRMDRRRRKIIDTIANVAIIVTIVTVSLVAFSYNTEYTMGIGHDKPIYQGDRDTNKVTIMFNVYWGTEYIDGILDVLDRYNVKTTFFIGGSWAEKNVDVLREIYARGHEIGNHGYFHKDQDKLDYIHNMHEIEPNNLLIEGIIGVKPRLFAPPSGAYNSNTLKASEDNGMYTIMWSRDTIDWRDKDVALIKKRATDGVKGGELILAHPTKCTLDALPSILEYYVCNGLECVSVSKNVGL